MTMCRRASDTVSIPTFAQAMQDLDTQGARTASGQVAVEAVYTGASPITVPVGGILLAMTFSGANNPPGIVTAGVNVPEVFVFPIRMGHVLFTLDAAVDVVGSQGVRQWVYQAEFGFNLDSLTPDPPFFIFTSSGGSTNTAVTATMNRSQIALSTVNNLHVQLRLSHDGGGDIDVNPQQISSIAVGQAPGNFMRL